jgi:glycosyltransferase involved in cell wall biosynthesis
MAAEVRVAGERARGRPVSPRAAIGPSPEGPRIAIVHDWVVDLGGAERVLAALLEAFPTAGLFTLFFRQESVRRLDLPSGRVRASFLQGVPGLERYYRSLLPVFPAAVRSLDLSAYDVVVSSSHCVAKGVRLSPGQLHLCYCHTPMRYAWHQEGDYLRLHGLGGGWRGRAARVLLARLRRWDAATAARVDLFLANSTATADRIRSFYGREAEVVHPPVDLARFAVRGRKDDFFLFVSRLVPYKRADLAVRSFSRLGLPLVVVGDGPAMAECRRLAGPTVRFLGWQDDATVADLMARARALVFTADEDFGIVPVEAQAAGTPVIAYGRGGARDSVVPADGANWEAATGLFFPEQSPEHLEEAVRRFVAWEGRFAPAVLRRNAERFDRARFVQAVRGVVARLVPDGSVAAGRLRGAAS